jgi:hypothetical protein
VRQQLLQRSCSSGLSRWCLLEDVDELRERLAGGGERVDLLV